LTEEKDEKPRRHYFDVDAYHRIHVATSKKRGRLGRALNRFTWTIGSMIGLFTGLFFPIMLIFGPLVGILMILYYGGGLAFYGTVGAFFVVVGFVGERKFGGSLQFNDYNFWKKTLAQILAYSVVAGVLIMILYMVKR